MKFKKYIFLVCLATSILSGSAIAQPLSLDQFIERAIETDPVLSQIASNANSMEAKAVADAQLPDPKAMVAFQNFPVDDFSRTREGMTQIVTGVSQKIPRGRSLRYKSEQTRLKARSLEAEIALREMDVIRSVRKLWFDLYYWERAAKTIARSEDLLQKIIEATELHYGTGAQNAQDVIGAELELSVLQDKKIDVLRRIDTLKAELAKWVGYEFVAQEFEEEFPLLPELKPYAELETQLINHPRVRAVDALIESERQGVKLAEAQYKPGFDVGLTYGFREGDLPNGHDRPDFLTAKLTFDLPLFVDKRQDKQLAASNYKVSAVQYRRDDILRDLQAQLQSHHANWKRYEQRANHYKQSVIRRAEENIEASLEAYGEDRTNFASLMRAQVVELDTQLNYIKIKTSRAKAQTDLLYLQGGTHE